MQHFRRDVPSTSPHQRQVVFVTVSKTNDEDHITRSGSFNPLGIDTLSYSTSFKVKLILIIGFVAASVFLSLRGALYPASPT